MSQKAPKFRSNFEKTVWEAMINEGEKADYEAVKLNYTISATYTPDLRLPNGILVEIKGKLDAPTRRKMLAVKKANPKLDIRFVFMRANNPIRKGAKTRYWEWAEKAGFGWSEKTVPKEWFSEKPGKK